MNAATDAAEARIMSCLRDNLIRPTDTGLWSRRRTALQNLEVLAAARAEIDALITANVETARTEAFGVWRDRGMSWAEIGRALGLTKQGAQKRFAGSRANGNES